MHFKYYALKSKKNTILLLKMKKNFTKLHNDSYCDRISRKTMDCMRNFVGYKRSKGDPLLVNKGLLRIMERRRKIVSKYRVSHET